MKKMNKKGLEMEMLGYYILGAVVLVIALISYFLLKDKGLGALDFIKNMVRLGK